MANNLKYIVDEHGNKISVLVPVTVWEDLNSNYKKIQSKLAVFESMKQGLGEVITTRKNRKKLQPLQDILK